MTNKINTTQLALILICNIIGAGIFIVQPQIHSTTSSNFITLCCWCFSAIIVLMFGQCYAELGCTYPLEGGDAWYLKLAYGSILSYFYAAISVCIILPCGCALMMHQICNGRICEAYTKILQFAMACFFAVLNFFGGKTVFRLQYALTILKIAAMCVFGFLALLVFLNFIKISSDHSSYAALEIFKINGDSPSFPTVLCQILAGSAAVLWTYDGWSSGNFFAHTIATPYPSFPIAIAAASTIVWILYLLINLSFMYVLPNSKLTEGDVVTSYFNCLEMNNMVKKVLSNLIGIIPSLGTFNGSFIVAASIIENYATQYALYRNKNKIISDSNSENCDFQESTSNSDIQQLKGKSRALMQRIKLCSLIIFALVVYGCVHINSSDILSKLSFVIYLFYGASIAAILILRKRDSEKRRPYRVPVPLIYSCILFTISLGIFNIYQTFIE